MKHNLLPASIRNLTAALRSASNVVKKIYVNEIILYCYYKTGEFETESKSTRMEWRNEILQGIDVLPKLGNPGRIVVYGKHAEPILTGNFEVDVLLAAAEFGQGRIVVIAQNDYASMILENDQSTVKALSKFHTNLKQWLTRGTYEALDSIVNAKDKVSKEKLMSSKVVIFDGNVGAISLRDLTEYVRNGGALFYCLTPIRWLQSNKGKTLFDLPYMNLLTEVGISFTDENNDVDEAGFLVEANAAEYAHLLRALEKYRRIQYSITAESIMLASLQFVPREKLLQLNSTLEMIWKNCREQIGEGFIPGRTDALDEKDKVILRLWLLCYDVLQPPNIKAPGVIFFPGDFSDKPPLKHHTLEFHSDREDFHSTACYLPAGQTLKVEVLSGNEGQDWELLIGCHTDDLRNQNKLQRWPIVHKKVKLTQRGLEVSTPFGGLIYLISPNKPRQRISMKLENVVDSPNFSLTKGEKAKTTWEVSRKSPGLWADIEGRFITITLPASSVREMEFDALTSVMNTWDSVVRLSGALREMDVSSHQRIWIVTDVQPIAGYMHSGYPIVTHLDVANPNGRDFLLNGSVIQKVGNWDAFHEIGHMMTLDEWSFGGTRESSADIFTLYTMETVVHLTLFNKPWIRDNNGGLRRFLKDGADFGSFEKFGMFIYAQLAQEFGWKSYTRVFHEYQRMSQSEKPNDDQTRIDTWFIIFSKVVNRNLSPLASFWGIPLSPETIDGLHIAFPVGFLPDDEFTRLAPDRVEAVLRQFPGTFGRFCNLA